MMRGRWSLSALTVVVLMLAFGATPTTVHTTVPREWRVIDSYPHPPPDPTCRDCPVVEQESGEAGPWDESPAIPTARFETRARSVTLTVEVRPPSPLMGERAQVRVVVTSPVDGPLSTGLAFGFERPQPNSHVLVDCFPSSRPQPTTGPRKMQRKTLVREVRFNVAGPQRVSALGAVHHCRHSDDAELTGSVVVRPSRLPTNGPTLPTATIAPAHAFASFPHARLVHMLFSGGDADGYIRHLDIDWGDGALSETIAGDVDPCTHTPTAASSAIPPGVRPHLYTRDGTYRVTVTAVSSGCDGRTRQTGRAHYVVTVPAG